MEIEILHLEFVQQFEERQNYLRLANALAIRSLLRNQRRRRLRANAFAVRALRKQLLIRESEKNVW